MVPTSTLHDSALHDSALLRACRREPVPHTPVWFMRQAGRSLPEYRAVRAGVAMLDACARPDLVTEITLQPVRRYGVDAAILFSDIVVPLKAIGVDLDIVPGVGPVVAQPFRTAADLDRLPELTADHVPYITEAVRQLVAELGPTPLIGFAGAPFTLASYLIEGGPSRNHEHTKALMYGDPGLWRELLARLAGIAGAFLRVQVEAGASAVQLFDSWVGALPLADYLRSVQPHSAAALGAVADLAVPRIHFGVGTGELLGAMGEAGAEVVGVDFRLTLAEGSRRAGPERAVQGNLDPAVVFAPWPAVRERVLAVLADAEGLPGHIFNLGHGVPRRLRPGRARPHRRPRARADGVAGLRLHHRRRGAARAGRGPRAAETARDQPGRDGQEAEQDQERQHRADHRERHHERGREGVPAMTEAGHEPGAGLRGLGRGAPGLVSVTFSVASADLVVEALQLGLHRLQGALPGGQLALDQHDVRDPGGPREQGPDPRDARPLGSQPAGHVNGLLRHVRAVLAAGPDGPEGRDLAGHRAELGRRHLEGERGAGRRAAAAGLLVADVTAGRRRRLTDPVRGLGDVADGQAQRGSAG